MRKVQVACLLLAVCVVAGSMKSTAFAAPLQAHEMTSGSTFDFFARGPYRSGVPKPEDVLGFKLGDRETTYWEQDRVVTMIADAAKDRVRIIPYGKSNEGRPLRIVAISSPENLARLEQIRAQNMKLADPRGLSPQEEAEIVASMPTIVWINENVHGDESTSFESGMQLIYQLAASEEAKTVESLKNCVVLVNPTFNPDGHERFAVYHNSVGMADPNNDAYEHGQPWAMYGRFNHYRFDMNRDKLACSQLEIQQEIAEYQRWMPHVYVDQHGEVTQYFFPPVALPINMNLDVDRQQKWLDTFGRGNASAFDRFGWGYYNRKIFDFFYVGYLDSWSALNGAIGMTYETDGGGNWGFAWNRDDDTVITLRDGVAHHYVAAMATIETASANREAKLRDFLAFRRAALDEGKTGSMRRVVIDPTRDPGRAAQLATILRRNGVEVGVNTGEYSTADAHSYADGPEAASVQKKFAQGVYVVEMSQPQGHLARAFLEPDAKLNKEFVVDELGKRDRNDKRGKNTPQEGAGFYDITAWSLPYAMGVDAYWVSDGPPPATTLLGPVVEPEGGRRAPFAPEGRLVGGRGTQAYVFPYETDASARLALALMKEGYKIATAPYKIKAGGKWFPRGSIILRTERNPQALAARIGQLARDFGVEVTAVDSQYADEWNVGIGSEDVSTLVAPKILVAAGDGVSQTSFGAIWFMLEREAHYPFTAMDLEQIPYTNLKKFNVIVLPDGYTGAYSQKIGKEGVERLKAWVREGGTIVAFGGATAFLVDKELKLTTAQPATAENAGEKKADEGAAEKPDDAKSEEPPKEAKGKKEKRQEPAKEPGKDDATSGGEANAKPVPDTPLYVPGAIYRASVDQKYFMSFGFDNETLAVPVNSDLFLRPSEDGANIIVFDAKSMKRLSGFIWPKNTEQLLTGTSYLIEEPMGGGHIVLFTEDIAFRRIWRGLDRLIYNSLIFAPGL